MAEMGRTLEVGRKSYEIDILDAPGSPHDGESSVEVAGIVIRSTRHDHLMQLLTAEFGGGESIAEQMEKAVRTPDHVVYWSGRLRVLAEIMRLDVSVVTKDLAA